MFIEGARWDATEDVLTSQVALHLPSLLPLRWDATEDLLTSRVQGYFHLWEPF